MGWRAPRWLRHRPGSAAGRPGHTCRSCLERKHEIPKGRPLSADERDYVVDVICRWIERERAVA